MWANKVLNTQLGSAVLKKRKSKEEESEDMSYFEEEEYLVEALFSRTAK